MGRTDEYRHVERFACEQSTEDRSVIQHTLGPWHISDRDPQRDQFYIFGQDFTGQDYPVAIVTSCEDPDQHEANARLIAAAPDLLAALKGVTAWVETRMPIAGDEIHAADRIVADCLRYIAKAEGR